MASQTSSGYDDTSLKLLKSIKHMLLEPLTLIINQMLNTGIFPDKLKIAKVIPIYKKETKQYSPTTFQFLCYHRFLRYLKKLFSYNHIHILKMRKYSMLDNMALNVGTLQNWQS